MFSRLFNRITLFTILPIALVLVFGIVYYFINRKKGNKKFALNYVLKVLFMISIGVVLSLIGGFSFWVIESFWRRELFFNNLLYIALLVFLVLFLIVLLVWIFLKLVKEVEGQSIEHSDV